MALGGYLIWAAFVFCLLTLLAYILDRRGWTGYGYVTMTLFLIAPSVLLFYHFISRDFSIEYVAAYSSSDLPMIYTISAFWAGQEGSFLLWAVIAACVGLFLLNVKWEWQRPVMICYNAILLSLLVLLLKQSPFVLLERVPPDGNGLNPLLQNPWMAIHPPMMFLGYAAYGFPFAFVMAALWKKEISHWVEISYRWLVFSWLSLGVGIILGGYWAYETLGWGGYWGWDPVENASLVPWLFGTALLHGLILQKRYGAFQKSNVLLAIFSFIFIIYGTFLTRSGVLADFSVHSFLDLGITGWMLIILFLFLAGGLVLFFLRLKDFPKGKPIRGYLTPPALLAMAVILFTLSGLMVSLGTSSPLITRVLKNPSQVGIPFYVNTQIPIYVLLLVVLTLFAVRKKHLVVIVPAVLVVLAASVTFGIHHPIHLMVIAVSASAMIAQVLNPRKLSAAFLHVGAALFILGSVYATGYDTLTGVRLTRGVPVEAAGRVLTFLEYREPKPGKKPAVITKVQRGKKEYTATPSLWYYRKTNQIFANPDIRMGLLRDEYYAAHEYLPPSAGGQNVTVKKGETFQAGEAVLTFHKFEIDDAHQTGGHMTVRAVLTLEGEPRREIKPVFKVIPGSEPDTPFVEIPGHNLRIKLDRIEASSGTVRLTWRGENATTTPAEAVVDVTIVPLISLVWLGTLLMVAGGILALLPERGDKVIAQSVNN